MELFSRHLCVVPKHLAKNFIKSLLNPNPTQRPTAAAALADHVRIRFPSLTPRN